MRAVFDTNVLLSAFLFEGVQAQAVRLTCEPGFQLLISETIREEFRAKLARKFDRDGDEIQNMMDVLESLATTVCSETIVSVCRDSKDNHVLACAVDGMADCIVSGDKDLLSMNAYQGIPILTIRHFIDAAISRKLLR